MEKVSRVCECGHDESDHADIGFRPCAKQNCPCRGYLEDDDPIKWNPVQGNGMPIISFIAWAGFACFLLWQCMGPGASTPAEPPMPLKPVKVDTCTRWPDGTIKECPDPVPPGGRRIKMKRIDGKEIIVCR